MSFKFGEAISVSFNGAVKVKGVSSRLDNMLIPQAEVTFETRTGMFNDRIRMHIRPILDAKDEFDILIYGQDKAFFNAALLQAIHGNDEPLIIDSEGMSFSANNVEELVRLLSQKPNQNPKKLSGLQAALAAPLKMLSR